MCRTSRMNGTMCTLTYSREAGHDGQGAPTTQAEAGTAEEGRGTTEGAQTPAHDLAGAEDAAVDRRALEPLASLPDESFFDALTPRSVD